MTLSQTLTQTALARRLKKSAGWIRGQGELVTARGETWARMEYANHRCAGYRLVTVVQSIATRREALTIR